MLRQSRAGMRRLSWLSAAVLCLSGLSAAERQQRAIAKPFPLIVAGAPLTADEYNIQQLPLSGPIADRESEISGLTWYGDWLILLPQYPERVGNALYAIPKAEILIALSEESTEPLSPQPIDFQSPDYANEMPGFEGFEAIVFDGNRAYLTIEQETAAGASGYVVSAMLSEDGTQLRIDAGQALVSSPSQSSSPNKADESILVTSDRVVSFYEVSGLALNPSPVAHSFDHSLQPLSDIPFPTLEYRLTDVTELDEQQRFWGINYFYPGDRDLIPERDRLALRYGRGATHRQYPAVERLVEFAYSDESISLTSTPPIQLSLIEDGRNWEGLARLDHDSYSGFLIATDKFPSTQLGFVAYSGW